MRVDFRSDTVTKPSKEMLEAMFQAEVGDDVFEEDPTVNKLEQKAAEMFGKEAALFCSSGTQTNQIAINVLTHPGDEVICERLSHIYVYEGGGIASNSGVTSQLITGIKGQVTAEQIETVIKADNVHFPTSKLVSLENTCNKAGGTIYSLAEIQRIQQLCATHELGLHLDGARIFNAIVAANYNTKDIGEAFDTLSICLSKGLGAPIGSLILGSAEFIKKSRRVRKRFGGGMRQVGYIAAAGIYALDHNVQRLQEDHNKAKILGQAFSEKSFVESVTEVETNIVMVHLDSEKSKNKLLSLLSDANIHALTLSNKSIRFVTHLDITEAHMDYTLSKINELELN